MRLACDPHASGMPDALLLLLLLLLLSLPPPTPPRETELTGAELERFNRFWQVYPKKRSRGQAEKAWLKVRPSEQLLATMIATIERAKTSTDWRREGGKFIPYPASWLNAKGWEDVIQPETGGPRADTTAYRVVMKHGDIPLREAIGK